MALSRAALLVALTLSVGACATYRDQLGRSQRAFEENDHERALAILRDLEPDAARLGPAEQAQYAYVRGMSDYRIGYRSDARHWLSVAKAYEDASPGMLPSHWKTSTNEALGELNKVVYSEGFQALATSERADDSTSGAAPSAATPKTSAPKP